MVIENRALAGRKTSLPNNEIAVFDAEGKANVSPECGLFFPDGRTRVPGFKLLEGIPTTVETDAREIIVADGPQTVCVCPPNMAGTSTACPDGHTVAHFNAKRLALVPSTCRLDEVAGFRFLDAKDLALAEAQVVELEEWKAQKEAPIAPNPAESASKLEYVRNIEENDRPRQKWEENPQPPDPRVAHGTAELPLTTQGPRESLAMSPGQSHRENLSRSPNDAPAGEGNQQRPDQRVAQGTAELPLPNQDQSHRENLSRSPNDVPAGEDVPLVPVSEEEKAAMHEASAGLPPEQQAQLEGGKPTSSPWTCDVCGKSDFQSRQGYAAHKHANKCSAPTAPTAPATEETGNVSAPSQESPATNAQQEAVAAATAAIKN